MPFGKSREEMTAQIKCAAEKISGGIAAVLGVALLALAVSACALITSLKVMKAVQA
jgi:hypothetical protein